MKTHPLTPAALKVLRWIERAPVPRHEVNPGVRDRLFREALVENQTLPNPEYKPGRKPTFVFLVITAAGREVLR